MTDEEAAPDEAVRADPVDGGCHLRQGRAMSVVTVSRDQLPQSFFRERDYYGLTPPGDRFRQEVSPSPPPE